MPPYRFFFWEDAADRIAQVDVIDCADDTGALARADKSFGENPDYKLAEIWKDDRLVTRRERLR
jgi:hypothetical protein